MSTLSTDIVSGSASVGRQLASRFWERMIASAAHVCRL